MAIALAAVSAPNLFSPHRNVRLFQNPAHSSTSQREQLFSKTLVFPALRTQSRIINPIHGRFSWRIGASASEKGSLFDAFVSAAEVLCIVPPVMYSISFLINTFFPNVMTQFQFAYANHELPSFLPNVMKQLQFPPGNELFASQCFLLLGAVVIASLIRRKQWKQFYNRGSSFDLISRIEKLEDDLESSAMVTTELSEHIENLSIPISEMAALAQKNSEEMVALTAQKEMLEKELHGILQVLLAMQEQQRRQFELILEVGHASKVIDENQELSAEENNTKEDTIATTEEMETKEEEIQCEAVANGGCDSA